jgi:signal transduction histidine kinase
MIIAKKQDCQFILNISHCDFVEKPIAKTIYRIVQEAFTNIVTLWKLLLDKANIYIPSSKTKITKAIAQYKR